MSRDSEIGDRGPQGAQHAENDGDAGVQRAAEIGPEGRLVEVLEPRPDHLLTRLLVLNEFRGRPRLAVDLQRHAPGLERVVHFDRAQHEDRGEDDRGAGREDLMGLA